MTNKNKSEFFEFFSHDFYLGTRTMIPEERAAYIDLLIYQHQKGGIPNDSKTLERLKMFCTGCSEATLKGVLEAKFKPPSSDSNILVNERLYQQMQNSSIKKEKYSKSGMIGQFYKQAKRQLKFSEYKQLKEFISSHTDKNFLFSLIQKNENDYTRTLNDCFSERLTYIKDKDSLFSFKDSKNSVGRFQVPTEKEIFDYLCEKQYPHDKKSFVTKFWNFYNSKGWKIGKSKMKSWKSAVATWIQKEKDEDKNNPPKRIAKKGAYAGIEIQ